MTVPGKELVVPRAPEARHANEDTYVAIRDAFDSMRRQLSRISFAVRRRKVKRHTAHLHGRVCSMCPEHDYGKLETPDNREIHFHRNSIVDGTFDDLMIGSELRFVEEAGEEGPQARSAYIVGKHQPLP